MLMKIKYKIITIEEHKQPDDNNDLMLLQQKIPVSRDNNGIYMGPPLHLNINHDGFASYYIGTDWLIENECAVTVRPKFEGTDFACMFITALRTCNERESEYFSKCYGIDFSAKPIACPRNLNLLTPLLVAHYVITLEKLVVHGLRKNYTRHTENLTGKIKGKILVAENTRQNGILSRYDRMYCRYQEFTEDIPENRILKRALNFADNAIMQYGSFKGYTDIRLRIGKLFAKFHNVGDRVSLKEVQRVSTNKIFKYYEEAIRLAKMILRLFDYSLEKSVQVQATVQPFWIDMSRLYEMYVLNMLRGYTDDTIEFQKKGYNGENVADYVIAEQRLILDAKYKEKYKYGYDKQDVRELSAYSRDEKLLPDTDETFAPRCVIIYPGESDDLNANIPLSVLGSKINGYRNFYKISIPVPRKNG